MKELEDVIDDPSSSPADVYMAMMKLTFDWPLVIGCKMTKDDVRRWWIGERANRKRYALSEEQEQEVIDMCRAMVAVLPDAERQPRLDPKDRRHRKRR